MKRVKRTNMIIVNIQQQWIGFMPRQDTYAMNINRERNCYNCGGFSHITRYYRNQRMVKWERKISYQNNDEHLKEEESLVVFNQVLIITIGLQYSVVT